MPLCLLSLGSNLGDRAAQLRQAVARLAKLPETRLLAVSRWHSSQPVGGPPGQADFLNGAAQLETMLAPEAVLADCQAIEAELGRVRHERWEARPLDLDLLLYDELQMDTPELILPHPRMAFRRFVLAPAVEIAPQMRHGTTGWTVAELWRHLNTAPNYVALSGGTGAVRQEIASRAAQSAAAGTLLLADVRSHSGGPSWSENFPSTTSQQSAATISDFWLADLVARGEKNLAASLAEIPRPKLLVRLAGPADDASATLTFNGPELRLRSDDVELAVADVAAAVQAMR